MLFFFRGRYGVAARAVIGVALVVLGLALRDGIVLVVIGAGLIAWSAVGGTGVLRARDRQARDGSLR